MRLAEIFSIQRGLTVSKPTIPAFSATRRAARSEIRSKANTETSPFESTEWFTGTPIKAPDKSGDKPNPTSDYISTDDALDLAKAYGGHTEWDPVDRTAWLYLYRDDEREWIFYTDARTFKERYTLAKDRGLRGFASWVLGTEDAGIWDLLPSHK